MKKVLKVASILAVVFAMLFALTGCGGNKLVATKDHDDNEKETVEISFNKDNEAEKIKMVYKLSSDSDAKDAFESAKSLYGDNVKVKRSGKKVEITMNYDEFAKSMGIYSKKLTKDDAKTMFEKAGYKVK